MSRTRAVVNALAGRVTTAAAALDAADARCAVGDRFGAARLRTAHATDVAQGTAAVAALPAAVRAYQAALAAVRSNRPAVQAAVRAGDAEAAALAAFASTARSVWPRYALLDRQEATWVHRALVPWYRSTQESANAYTVLTDGTRAPLNAARRELAAASKALGPVQLRAVAAYSAADQALAASPVPS